MMTSSVKFWKNFQKFRYSPLGVVIDEIVWPTLSQCHEHLICREKVRHDASRDQIFRFVSKSVILTTEIMNRHQTS